MSQMDLPQWLQEAKKIAIVGYGREGKSTEKFLRSYLPSAWILIFDNQETFDIPKVDVIFKSPGVQLSAISYKLPAYLTSQADVFMQMFAEQTIGVTGTKGKSTTSHAIAHVLASAGKHSILLGNIGKPALDSVDQIDDDTVVVFELSSFQTESLHVAPHIAVFTSLYQDHLDYYQDYNAYKQAKKHLFDLQKKDDICIYRGEYPELRELLADCPAEKMSYTKDMFPLPVNYIPARLIGPLYGLSQKQMDGAFATIQPLPGRLECVATVQNVRFIDDALATIPEATIDALNTLGDDVVVLIAGGHERKQDYRDLAKRITRSNVHTLILFPTTGERLADEVKKLHSSIQLVQVNSMQEAVSTAYQSAKSSKLPARNASHNDAGGSSVSSPIVLLSTGAPSFGLFRDYADRSKQYVQYIRELERS